MKSVLFYLRFQNVRLLFSANLFFSTMPKLAYFFAVFSVFLIALRPRIGQLYREFWSDELMHNADLVHVSGFDGLVALFSTTAASIQPAMDYLLRKYFWFPLTGTSELALRAPSLFYSCITVSVFSYFCWRHFSRRDSSLTALICTLLLTAWISGHGGEVYYSAEARHYSLTSLLSLIWCLSFVFWHKSEGWQALIGALFCGTHYFAVPIVVAGAVYNFLRSAIAREQLRSGARVGYFFLSLSLVAVSYAMNSYYMGLPTPVSFRWEKVQSLTLLSEVIPIILSYFRYWDLPIWLVLMGSGLLAVSLRSSVKTSDSERVARFVFLISVVFALFFFLRTFSTYPYSPRYHTPFFGVIAVFLVLVTSIRVSNPRWSRIRLSLIVVGAILFTIKLLNMGGTWTFPPHQFSHLYSSFQLAKKDGGVPHLFVLFPCSNHYVQSYYWGPTGQNLAAHNSRLWRSADNSHVCYFHDQKSELSPSESLDEYLGEFFSKNADGNSVIMIRSTQTSSSFNEALMQFGPAWRNDFLLKKNIRSDHALKEIWNEFLSGSTHL